MDFDEGQVIFKINYERLSIQHAILDIKDLNHEFENIGTDLFD